MKKKIILKSSILAVAAGLSVFAINSVFADELPVQFMGVNDFHGALEQTGTARLEGETVKNAGTAPLLATYLNDSQKTLKQRMQERLMPASVCKREIWLALVQPTLPSFKMNQL